MIRERRPGMELPFDAPSSAAYNRISRIPIFNFERGLFMRELRKYKLSGTLLDIGCGPGFLDAEIIRRYPSLEVIGLDISPDMLDLAERNLPAGRIRLLLGDAARLPLPDSSADFVVSSASLHHWDDPSAAFREIYRVTKPCGRFLIMDLRRDASDMAYCAAGFLNVFAPAELKRTQGALGSLYTSYTPSEVAAMLQPMAFREVTLSRGPVWMFVTGLK